MVKNPGKVRARTYGTKSPSRSEAHALYYRKRGSASYIAREVLLMRERERYREREIDGSDVTIVALKVAMNLHFPLPKSSTIGDELTLSLATKNAILDSPFTLPVSPFTERSPWWR